MALFRDRYAEAKGVEHYERKVNRMKGPRASKPAPAPYTCGAQCDHPANRGGGCTSTVRGGVCPCRYC